MRTLKHRKFKIFALGHKASSERNGIQIEWAKTNFLHCWLDNK